MLRLRPLLEKDMDTIMSWCPDEKSFYNWSAGVLGEYPLTKERFERVREMIAFSAMEEKQVIGFFTMRNPGNTMDELRIGFVIIDPDYRGKGYGKRMLNLAVRYAKEIYGAHKVSLAVFDHNQAAYRCYRAAGFRETESSEKESYRIVGEEWNCIQMEIM